MERARSQPGLRCLRSGSRRKADGCRHSKVSRGDTSISLVADYPQFAEAARRVRGCCADEVLSTRVNKNRHCPLRVRKWPLRSRPRALESLPGILMVEVRFTQRDGRHVSQHPPRLRDPGQGRGRRRRTPIWISDRLQPAAPSARRALVPRHPAAGAGISTDTPFPECSRNRCDKSSLALQNGG